MIVNSERRTTCGRMGEVDVRCERVQSVLARMGDRGSSVWIRLSNMRGRQVGKDRDKYR